MLIDNNYLEVKVTQADDPWQNSCEVMLASEAAKRYPALTDIITHPDFSQLSYTVDLTKTEISWHSNHRYDDGRPSKADRFNQIENGYCPECDGKLDGGGYCAECHLIPALDPEYQEWLKAISPLPF